MTADEPPPDLAVANDCPERTTGDVLPRRRRLLVAVLVTLLPAVILGGAWRLGGVSALEDDLIYYLPIRQYIGERIRAGELPLWNPLAMMGTSIAADPQSGLWYPPTHLFVLLPPLVAYPVTIVLHFALAGAGMYRFLRASRHEWRAALLGAIAFEFCGYLVAHRAHLTIHHATAWLPWIFLGWRRFADTGRYRHFALASAALGMQLLVQHIQISVITGALLTGYVAIVLLPRRRALLWCYPAGMMAGAMLAAVQLLPTWLHYSASGRATPAYSLFIENSWMPTSALITFFPMLFGSRTPNFWDQPWWGLSHFCEQSVYPTILVLVLAGSSIGLLTHRKWVTVPNLGGSLGRREVAFWWVASLVALVLALGRFMPAFAPVSKWLFHLPVYRSFRVPARWMLVWSVAMPILASTVASVMLRGGEDPKHVARWVRMMASRVLPAAAVVCVLVMIIARWQVGRIEDACGNLWHAQTELAGLRSAICFGNRAIWWPMLMMIVTGCTLVCWSRGDGKRSFPLLLCVLLIDIASVAAFVDVDVSTYRRVDLQAPPALAEAIRQREPKLGHRLLVPRLQADYDRPIEVLWPNTNMQHGVATFNGYGPFWTPANRMLFRFMPWGSSEGMLELLRNPRLMQAIGIRFLAARTPEERRLLAAAMLPAQGDELIASIPGTENTTPVRYGADILWPVRIGQPGIYELAFDAEPVPSAPSRWYVRLETPSGEEIGWTRAMQPVDLAGGKRRVWFLFHVDRGIGPARVRIKSQMGQALSVCHATFGQRAPGSRASTPVDEDSEAPSPFLAPVDVDGVVELRELPGAVELVRWADRVEPATDLVDAVEKLQGRTAEMGLPGTVVVEWPESAEPLPGAGGGPLTYDRLSGHEICIEVDAAARGLLVFNETYDPGWRATIGGQPAAIHRVNAVCQGVIVPPGPQEVRFIYRPRGLTTGVALSAAAWLLLAAGFSATVKRRRA